VVVVVLVIGLQVAFIRTAGTAAVVAHIPSGFLRRQMWGQQKLSPLVLAVLAALELPLLETLAQMVEILPLGVF
jgi:hypothetical protein